MTENRPYGVAVRDNRTGVITGRVFHDKMEYQACLADNGLLPYEVPIEIDVPFARVQELIAAVPIDAYILSAQLDSMENGQVSSKLLRLNLENVASLHSRRTGMSQEKAMREIALKSLMIRIERIT